MKNNISIPSRPDLHIGMYVERYSTKYTANKNQVKDLYFDHIAPTFSHDTSSIPKKFRKDFADCVIQVLGFIKFGDLETAATKF